MWNLSEFAMNSFLLHLERAVKAQIPFSVSAIKIDEQVPELKEYEADREFEMIGPKAHS